MKVAHNQETTVNIKFVSAVICLHVYNLFEIPIFAQTLNNCSNDLVIFLMDIIRERFIISERSKPRNLGEGDQGRVGHFFETA